jgi:hypothetical protein
MPNLMKKTDLTPVETLLVERALGEEARLDAQRGTLARIQALTAERQRLFALSASNPFLGPVNGPRIRELGAEIERLWSVLRRERATRRVELERALHVESEDEESGPADAKAETTDAA